MALNSPATTKTAPLSKAERAELLSLCLMVKSEVDALLQRLPKATVALVIGSVAGILDNLSCSALKDPISCESETVTIPKHDGRLASLRFLPPIAALLARSGCTFSQSDLLALAVPARFRLAKNHASAEHIALHQIAAQRLQDLLRELIAYLAGGSTGRRIAIDQGSEAIILEVLRQMRQVVIRAPVTRVAANSRTLNSWGIKPVNKKNRSTFRIGTHAAYPRNKLYDAINAAAARGLISKFGIGERRFTYELTQAGRAAAEVASFLKKLREETVHRSVTLRLASDGRIWCSAPATRGRRARKWIDMVGSSPDREAALRLKTAPPPTGRKNSKTRTQTRSPRRP